LVAKYLMMAREIRCAAEILRFWLRQNDDSMIDF